ncbi:MULTISPECIES: hypothetical protein [Lysinibacillus]|uniref:hypothetical protein n=1 Tax=Lysinibacillus TaxID=400634 RepID=UPI0004D8BB1F|nr:MULTISPECIES: hypothetical protein [Lysinibacillus]AJK87218.1 hypothetical protein HR49_08610 [Lysinibacillus fusiformis]KHK55008.1 hypothetical protein PI85_03815 [Lysinibacillus sp. A1]
MLKSLRPTNSSITKVKTSSGDKNRITSEAELKALLDEHRKTRVIGSDGEPITTLMDKRKVLSAESTATPDGLYPYLMAGSKMTYSMFIEDYLKLSDAKAPIGEQFEAALSLINPVGKAKKGKDALEALRDWEKGIEETYDLANNSKKAKDAKTTQKEIDQLGEYVKKHDKGTGNVGKGASGAENVAKFEKLRAEYAAKESINAERIGSGLKEDNIHRAASFFLSEEQLASGKVFNIKGGDGINRTLLQTKGELDGNSGIYEYILTPEGKVTHQRFINSA